MEKVPLHHLLWAITKHRMVEACPQAYRDDELIRRAVAGLRHDEHFDWALCGNIISRAVIISLAGCAVCRPDELAVAQKPERRLDPQNGGSGHPADQG